MFFSNDYTFLKKTYGIENGNADNVNKNDKRILTLVEQKYKINDIMIMRMVVMMMKDRPLLLPQQSLPSLLNH